MRVRERGLGPHPAPSAQQRAAFKEKPFSRPQQTLHLIFRPGYVLHESLLAELRERAALTLDKNYGRGGLTTATDNLVDENLAVLNENQEE